MLLATALAPLLQDGQQTFIRSKQTGRHQRKPSFIISSFWIKQKKTVDAAKICGGAENEAAKTETCANIRKWIAGFINFVSIYTPLEARVLSLIILHELPIDMGNSICTCSLIYSGFLPVTRYAISLLGGWNNPVQRCLPSGRLHYPRRGGGFTHWLTDCLMCNRRRPAATSSRRASFSALASAIPSCIFKHAQHHADASACQ